MNDEKLRIGLIGTGYKKYYEEPQMKCSAENCKALKVGDYRLFRLFDGTISDDCTLCENESEMPNILEVLGENFKMGPNGYPVLSWQ